MFAPHAHHDGLKLLTYTTPLFAGFIIPIITTIISVVEKVGVLVFDSLEAALKWLFKFTFNMFDIVRGIGRGLARAIRVVFRGFRHIIGDVFHFRLRHLYEDYLALKDKLARFFAPVLRILDRVDRWLRWREQFFIRPILDMIQRVRRILAVFRIFHLRFAEEADRFLAGVESRIIHNDRLLLGKVNEVGSLINLLVDPSLLFREAKMGLSFIRALGAAAGGFLGGPGVRAPLVGVDTQQWQPYVATFQPDLQTSSGDPGDVGKQVSDLLGRFNDELGTGGGTSA